MVKKAKETNKLTMNTATKKKEAQSFAGTIVNTSRLISVPVEYELAGRVVSFILPCGARQPLPQGAKLITNSQFVKVV